MPAINYVIHGFSSSRTSPGAITTQGLHTGEKNTAAIIIQDWVIDDNGLFQKKSTQVGWGHWISRGIEETACENSRSQLKKMWNFQGHSRKIHVEFPWLLVFNFGVSKRCPIILQNFQELKIVFSRISKVKVTNIKIPGSFFRKVFHEPLFRFFLEYSNLKRQIRNRNMYTCRLFQLTRVFQYISNWSKVFEHIPTLFLQYT